MLAGFSDYAQRIALCSSDCFSGPSGGEAQGPTDDNRTKPPGGHGRDLCGRDSERSEVGIRPTAPLCPGYDNGVAFRRIRELCRLDEMPGFVDGNAKHLAHPQVVSDREADRQPEGKPGHHAAARLSSTIAVTHGTNLPPWSRISV